LDRIRQHDLCRCVHVVAVPNGIDADTQSPNAFLQGCQIVGYRIEHRRRIVWVAAGDYTQNGGGVGRAAGHRADMVQRCGQFEYAVPADAPPSWLQTGQAVGGGWPTDRSTRIGPERPIAEACRRCSAGPARRYAGPVVSVPGILGWGDGRVVIGVGALGELQLAEQHRASLFETTYDGCVLVRAVVPVDRHPGRGRNAFDPAQVLDSDGP